MTHRLGGYFTQSTPVGVGKLTFDIAISPPDRHLRVTPSSFLELTSCHVGNYIE